jgi:hypothetical protein
MRRYRSALSITGRRLRPMLPALRRFASLSADNMRLDIIFNTKPCGILC